jgi:hypothetical protein
MSSVLFSCASDDNEEEQQKNNIEIKESDIQEIETLFDKDDFDDLTKVELLKELKICSDKNTSNEDYMHPSCSPRFFELFAYSENDPLKNAFVLLTKSKTYGFPLRRIAVFAREKGRLVKVNEFVANLIAMQKSNSGSKDLILRFNDKDQGEDVFYNCIFSWNGTKYAYKSVEVIEGANWGGPVKAELKDSISKEVEKDIIKNGMIL